MLNKNIFFFRFQNSCLVIFFLFFTGIGVSRGAGSNIEQSKSYGEALCGIQAFVNQGADLLAGRVIEEAKKISKSIVPFGVISYGSNSYGINTGAEVKIDGVEIIAVTGKAFKHEGNKVIIGLFCELGSGNYRTDSKQVNAKGKDEYIGGGLLGRIEVDENNKLLRLTKLPSLYVDGSLRVGNAKVDYDAVSQEEVVYDYSTLYYGLHLGCGCTYEIAKNYELDGYGRYTFTHQAEKEIKLSTSENVDFKEENSHRIRVGVKGKYEEETSEYYAGLAVEQGLDGEVMMNTENMSIVGIKSEGPTGILELGFEVEPMKFLSIGISTEGYLGNREGFLCTVKFSYAI
jgi:outer membrane autotransporter protein